MDDPVLKYVPELAEMEKKGDDDNGFPAKPWEDITLGALAAHIAAIGTDCMSPTVCPFDVEHFFFYQHIASCRGSFEYSASNVSIAASK